MEKQKQQKQQNQSVKKMDSKRKTQKATKAINKRRLPGIEEILKYGIKIAFRFALIVIIAFGGYYLYLNVLTVTRLQRELVDLRSAMNTDTVRQYKLQKVIQIIRDHNASIPSDEAYDIANTVHEMSLKYTNLDIDLLCAVITHESANTWDPKILSPAGAMGLMQIMPVTGMFLAEYENITWTEPEDVLFNPVYNIQMGSRYLSTLIEEYDLEGALAAYNGGERIAAVYMANGKDEKYLWEETRNYIPAVKSLYNNYVSRTM
ncbi:transglycosylase SLT domain-containing protein [bacterium]|nr:transglycosylase SLT domain-containing protein [bacterium]